MTGVILIYCLIVVVLGGLKKLANISTLLVPIMSIFYVVVGLLVILLNIQQVPSVIKEIFTQAFSMKAVVGGTGGYIIARAMQYGIIMVCIQMKLEKEQQHLYFYFSASQL